MRAKTTFPILLSDHEIPRLRFLFLKLSQKQVFTLELLGRAEETPTSAQAAPTPPEEAPIRAELMPTPPGEAPIRAELMPTPPGEAPIRAEPDST